MSFLRLRQVCLVARDLEREAARIGSLFGLEVCYRDPNVAKYGLENALFPVGATFLEIVSPTRAGTAAGRRRISLDAGTIDFLPSSASEEIVAGVTLDAADRASGAVEACGVRFRFA